jgi:crotonobetainyl-CoA:carnitine CoA-transferase CaiB-like acyl-CoA transferase
MSEKKKPAGPLDGIRVLDFSQAMAGPFAAQKLGDLGAEVIKVEPPGAGEWHRTRPAADAWVKDHNSSFLAFNRNKRSLAIDLKNPEAAPVVEKLVRSADVALMNFRPGVAERLKITYEDLRRHNPRIVVCSLTGYGSSGPYVKRPGQDLILQGYSGSMWNSGKEGDAPVASPLYVADATAAHLVVEAIVSALLWRERGGTGQLVEVNMLDAMVDLQVQELSVFLTGGVRPQRTKEPFAHVLLTAPYGVYPTKDGYMTVSIGPIPVLGEILDSDRLRNMKAWGDGMTHRDEIYRIVAEALPRHTTAEWLERFQAHDYWVGPVYDYDDLVADPQIKHNGTFIELEHPTEGTLKLPGIPIRYSQSPGSIRYHHPAVGEQSVAVLREIGFAEDEIAKLGRDGVVQLTSSPGRT